MSIEKGPDLSVLMTKLDRFHGLSDSDRAALQSRPVHAAAIAKGQDIVGGDEQAGRCVVVLAGLAFSYKLTGDGRRQILCFHLPGDLPDLQSLRFGATDAGVAAVSGCVVGYLPYDALSRLCSQHPSLADVLWRETLLQAAILREGLLNVGRRNALTRLAHLMCEMVVRHRVAGLTSDHGCDLPLTQMVLADALGLSVVHINRVIQELRSEGLMEWDGHYLRIADWERLRSVADFDPAYLHLARGSLAP